MNEVFILAVFLLAVYGFANAIAVLKIGCYFFGDPSDEVVLKDGQRIPWKSVQDRGDALEVEACDGRRTTYAKDEVEKVLRRKGLGRVPYVGDLFYCPACLAFWIGMAFSVWIVSPASMVCPVRWKAIMLDGFAACAASWLLHMATMRLGHGIEDA